MYDGALVRITRRSAKAAPPNRLPGVRRLGYGSANALTCLPTAANPYRQCRRQKLPRDVSNAARDPVGDCFQWIVPQMGVAIGRFHFVMTEHFPAMVSASPTRRPLLAYFCRRSRGDRTIGSGVQVSNKAFRNPLGGGLHRIPREVGVTGGCLDLTVAEKLTNHR